MYLHRLHDVFLIIVEIDYPCINIVCLFTIAVSIAAFLDLEVTLGP